MKKQLKPTKKQTIALQLISQGAAPGEAMKKAGYSELAARNPKQNLFKSPAVLQLYENLRGELNHQGITEAYIAEKFKQFMGAKKTDTDDYKTQLKAVDMYLDVQGIKEKKTDKKQPTRRITLEEFVFGPDHQ